MNPFKENGGPADHSPLLHRVSEHTVFVVVSIMANQSHCENQPLNTRLGTSLSPRFSDIPSTWIPCKPIYPQTQRQNRKTLLAGAGKEGFGNRDDLIRRQGLIKM